LVSHLFSFLPNAGRYQRIDGSPQLGKA
jgi:hypothetical protein